MSVLGRWGEWPQTDYLGPEALQLNSAASNLDLLFSYMCFYLLLNRDFLDLSLQSWSACDLFLWVFFSFFLIYFLFVVFFLIAPSFTEIITAFRWHNNKNLTACPLKAGCQTGFYSCPTAVTKLKAWAPICTGSGRKWDDFLAQSGYFMPVPFPTEGPFCPVSSQKTKKIPPFPSSGKK